MTPLPLRGRAALPLLFFVAAACEAPAGPQALPRPVVGGVLAPDHPAVGAIVPVAPTCGETIATAPLICSGTLIAPRVVLTAAHCVESAAAAQVLAVVFAPELGRALPAERVRAVDGRLHPAFRSGQNDLAVLILAEDAPVAPLPLGDSALPADLVGQLTEVVGFGLDDQGQTGRRRSGMARVTEVAAASFATAAAPGMSCGGDSGGPSFLAIDGITQLIGVTSFGDVACTIGTSTRVDVNRDFVQAILDEVAQAPPTRPPFDPAQDTCAARCQGHVDCPLGMACVPGADGTQRCAVAGLEAGRFGDACTEDAGGHLCVQAGATCRLWLPCNEAAAGGCTIAHGGPATLRDGAAVGGLCLWLVAALVLRLRRRVPIVGAPRRGAERRWVIWARRCQGARNRWPLSRATSRSRLGGQPLVAADQIAVRRDVLGQ